MKYFDLVVGQVIGWVVGLFLAFVASYLPSVRAWLAQRPWVAAVLAAVLISGLINALTLWELKANLLSWGGNKDSTASATCPDGMYAIGIKTVSVGGGNSGYLGSATLVCRPLKVQ
ncbi:hypothetical protein NKI89_24935 [Mesorhizobium sp. M0309]|uniref:hypothetical protein n=1 Tax=Mesorhizobium sp. M0309 TaxID=2956933 RepID=UPI00333A8447